MTTPHIESSEHTGGTTNGNGRHRESKNPELTRLLNAAGYASWMELVEKKVVNWGAVSRLNAGEVPPNHGLIKRVAETIKVAPELVAATQSAKPLDERRAAQSERAMQRNQRGELAARASTRQALPQRLRGDRGRRATARPNAEALAKVGYKGATQFGKQIDVSAALVSLFVDGKLPVNHPSLSRFAKVLGWSQARAAASQHGKPISEKEVKRLVARFYSDDMDKVAAAGPRRRGKGRKTIARGAKAVTTPPTGRPAIVKRSLAGIFEQSGQKSWNAVASAAGLSWAYVGQLKKGKMPPNHPAIAKLAAALNVSADELAATQKAPMLNERRLEVNARRMDAAPVSSPASRLRGKGETKQIVRSMITTVNFANMKGERTMEIPTADMAVFLRDYCTARGIDANIVVMESFDKLFK